MGFIYKYVFFDSSSVIDKSFTHAYWKLWEKNNQLKRKHTFLDSPTGWIKTKHLKERNVECTNVKCYKTKRGSKIIANIRSYVVMLHYCPKCAHPSSGTCNWEIAVCCCLRYLVFICCFVGLVLALCCCYTFPSWRRFGRLLQFLLINQRNIRQI